MPFRHRRVELLEFTDSGMGTCLDALLVASSPAKCGVCGSKNDFAKLSAMLESHGIEAVFVDPPRNKAKMRSELGKYTVSFIVALKP